jgi:hypothetical protein
MVAMVLVALAGALLPAPARAQSSGDMADEIIYIDPDGVVRVRDPLFTAVTQIAWFSPVGGYTDAVLLDVNSDDDLEIAALREVSEVFTLDIYDPVVASGPTAPGQSIGGVPWERIATIPLAGPVGVLGAGNLDDGAPGEEILLSARAPVPGDTTYTQSLYYLRNVGPEDGSQWQAQGLPVSNDDWTSVALGDMDLDGVDEIGLVASAAGVLSAWQMRGPFDAVNLFRNEAKNRPWLHVDMGPFLGGGDLLGAVRDAPIGLPSLFIFRYQDGELVDEFGRDFDPSPNFIFFSDINGSGDAEAYMIRFVDTTVTNKPRLFMRHRGSDPAALLEDNLDSDNGFKVGASGDIDGDKKDEVILIRDSAIREYLSPDTVVTFSTTALQSNAQTLVVGNLDGAGYLPEVVLQSSPASVTASAPSGAPATVTTIEVASLPTGQNVPLALSVEGRPAWLGASADSGVTPATITLTFDASTLSQGQYTASLVLRSSNPRVLQQPVTVPVTLNVGPGLLVRPTSIHFIVHDCPTTAVLTQTLAVEAPQGTAYSVSLLRTAADEAAGATSTQDVQWPSSVPWLSATSPTGVAPENITFTVDSTKAAGAAGARAIVMATVNGVSIVRTVPVVYLCAETQIHLPVVAR